MENKGTLPIGYAVLIGCAVSLGCAVLVAEPAFAQSREAVHGSHEMSAHTMKRPPLRFNLPRERAWRQLRRWLQGAAVDREPTISARLDDPIFPAVGEQLYGMYCVNCHGVRGKGDGARAATLDPPPRDFTSGLFKFRSTPSGEPPTPSDLFRTISGGLRGTGMLPFVDLPELQRWALVAYLSELAGNEGYEYDAGPVAVPDPPPHLGSNERVARGRSAYTRLGCDKCHGASGRGDGPSARDQVDANGKPLAPRDFVTQPLKRGNDAADVFRTIVTGMDGTPMPGYLEGASPDQVWDLVAFLSSLQSIPASTVSSLEFAQAREILSYQERQGEHAVVSGCGCQAGG